MCCQECKAGISAKRRMAEGVLPRFAIANNLAIGEAPPCLQLLTDIELALVSQARFRGHLFSYWGGCHKSIKGWHCFYEITPSHTMAVLQTVADLTQAENIAVVLSGPFTTRQKERILQKTHINTANVLHAFAWLKRNNRLYADIPAPTSIGTPILVDNSHEVESDNSDIETKEEVRVVFPDGTVETGGCADGAEFDKVIADIRAKCGSTIPFLTSRPSTRVLKDYEDETLMRAFPKQFPYGYGYHADFNLRSSQNGFLKHLVTLSIPSFHEAAFVLVVHNIFERSKALNGAVWRVMGGREKCEVTEDELNAAIYNQLSGYPPIHGPGANFLESIKSCKKQMSHTNAAAAAAQAKFISLTHHFGCAKVLFTVSFDDSLDIRILTLSGKTDTLAWIETLKTLPPDEISQHMDLLHSIRLTYPGICALTFEYLLDLVLEKIVAGGVFGKLDAYGVAVEEQGRKTLHAHILVFVSGWNQTLRDLHSSSTRVREQAEKGVIKFVDSVLSTELVPRIL
jgi:hypothetical protein